MTATGAVVPAFNTTLLGVVRAVADHFGLRHTDAALYGGSSHAFLINIHEALCPSGPYCWKPERFRRLLRNLGIQVIDHGFFGGGSGPEARAGIEALIREKLDQGAPCSLLNMENQLITGYDAEGFDTSRPWPANADFPPGRLSFGSWKEQGELHMSFFSYEPLAPAEARTIAADALVCAGDMLAHPEAFTDGPYGAGPVAYDRWIAAVEAGHGDSHGNWWNGTVWAECRARAGDYLRELASSFAEVEAECSGLAARYDEIAANLERASDKALDAAAKAELLRRTQALEREAAPDLNRVVKGLRAS